MTLLCLYLITGWSVLTSWGVKERAIDPKVFAANGRNGTVMDRIQAVAKEPQEQGSSELLEVKMETPSSVSRTASDGESARFQPQFDVKDALKKLESPRRELGRVYRSSIMIICGLNC